MLTASGLGHVDLNTQRSHALRDAERVVCSTAALPRGDEVSGARHCVRGTDAIEGRDHLTRNSASCCKRPTFAWFAVTFAWAAVMFASAAANIGDARIVGLHCFIDDLLRDGVLSPNGRSRSFVRRASSAFALSALESRLGLFERFLNACQRYCVSGAVAGRPQAMR